MTGILERFTAQPERGADGMPVRHPFTPEASHRFDPFLYLAHFGPERLERTRWGFGPHPHRGFETITYLISGSIEHRDSFGAQAVLEPGDVQWMTAGAGIVHSEQPSEAFRRSGGAVEGFQIWLNLPAVLKMADPGFQMLRASQFPSVEPAPGVRLRLIAGSLSDDVGPAATKSPVFLWHVSLDRGARWVASKPPGWNAFSYAFGAAAGETTVFDPAAERIGIENDARVALDVLVLGGEPLAEPVASYGPFVMRTRAELIQAVRDYESGRMGTLER